MIKLFVYIFLRGRLAAEEDHCHILFNLFNFRLFSTKVLLRWALNYELISVYHFYHSTVKKCLPFHVVNIYHWRKWVDQVGLIDLATAAITCLHKSYGMFIIFSLSYFHSVQSDGRWMVFC